MVGHDRVAEPRFAIGLRMAESDWRENLVEPLAGLAGAGFCYGFESVGCSALAGRGFAGAGSRDRRGGCGVEKIEGELQQPVHGPQV
jgi:hypothetical protein